jgi:hypothetical protein
MRVLVAILAGLIGGLILATILASVIADIDQAIEGTGGRIASLNRLARCSG